MNTSEIQSKSLQYYYVFLFHCFNYINESRTKSHKIFYKSDSKLKHVNGMCYIISETQTINVYLQYYLMYINQSI